MKTKVSPLFIILIVISPLIAYFLTWLLPTFDDWTYITTPNFNVEGSHVPQFLPFSSYWRPLDGLYGYFLSFHPELFPALNHILVYLAHLCSTFIVYGIAKQLGFNKNARTVCSTFFFVSPGMLGTVLGIDTLNQAYSQMWGFAATWVYLRASDRRHIILWIICAYLATFSKENGAAYFIIPIIIGYIFDKKTMRGSVRPLIYAAVCIAVYFTIRSLLHNEYVEMNDEYFDNFLYRSLKNIGVFVGLTWIPLDYICLVHSPNRNILVVILTLLLASPFLVWLFVSRRRQLAGRQIIGLTLCMLIASAPHLVTLFTTMHVYTSLSIAALIVGCLANKIDNNRTLYLLFSLYVVTSVAIDCHHWYKSYQSGLIGKKMGAEAIAKTGKAVDRVFVITIDNNSPKYSSFCVTPTDAFGWGYAAMNATGYEWPKEAMDTTIYLHDSMPIDSIADNALIMGYQRVWMVHGDTVDIIR